MTTNLAAATVETDKEVELIVPREFKQPWFKRLLPYIAWQVVALLAVEATLAFAGLGEEELFQLDPEIGTVHMTNKSITWRKEGYARSYLHSNGLRESGITEAKPAGVYRIVLLGDSQVEGIQVALEDTAGQLLEKRLTKILGRPVQVLNFGVSGYSTVQEFLLMKREVFKYSPDMVLMGYDSRDMFENWSAPDAAISNLRPYALKLPKQPVLVDSGPVKAFMKSPRGKFLNSIAWLRANSRIWGLISAYETEASSHNEAYKAIIGFFISPVKVTKQFREDAAKKDYWPNVGAQIFKATIGSIQMPNWQYTKPVAAVKVAVKQDLSKEAEEAQKQTDLAGKQAAFDKRKAALEEQAKVEASNKTFIGVITNTMEALLQEFKKETANHNCKFVVYALPSRATLAPIAGMDQPMLGVNHGSEVVIVKRQCQENEIPFIDAQRAATTYSDEKLNSLFYTAHLTPSGQKYVADQLDVPLAEIIRQSK
ncbi:MAG: SGNH/GDSL hydrolase family protein [Candidatus Melainabacteria bacterium]|nr:SGNH/GDSL hydrolase family protein [Candidatus Melainabacteria bacterium]